jgi:Ca2+/Na+ antiporter
MQRLLKKLFLSLAIFAIFCASGYLASSIETIHNSIAASTAIFSVSFVSLVTSAFKLWNDLFG